MRRANDLEQRLIDWGREYGGGRYEEIGWQGLSPLAVLMTYHGPAPQGLNPRGNKDHTPADDVQDAYLALMNQPQGWMPSQVLRLEYTLPGQPVESKLQKLRRIGENVSRVRYYQHLRIARVHVAGWIRLPFSDSESSEEKAA